MTTHVGTSYRRFSRVLPKCNIDIASFVNHDIEGLCTESLLESDVRLLRRGILMLIRPSQFYTRCRVTPSAETIASHQFEPNQAAQQAIAEELACIVLQA